MILVSLMLLQDENTSVCVATKVKHLDLCQLALGQHLHHQETDRQQDENKTRKFSVPFFNDFVVFY